MEKNASFRSLKKVGTLFGSVNTMVQEGVDNPNDKLPSRGEPKAMLPTTYLHIGDKCQPMAPCSSHDHCGESKGKVNFSRKRWHIWTRNWLNVNTAFVGIRDECLPHNITFLQVSASGSGWPASAIVRCAFLVWHATVISVVPDSKAAAFKDHVPVRRWDLKYCSWIRYKWSVLVVPLVERLER